MDCVREQNNSRWPSIETCTCLNLSRAQRELHEALRKDGFQSLFVAQSEAREVFFRIDMSVHRAACWTVASGMRLANHVKFQCAKIRKFGWCCEILSEGVALCGSRFQSKRALRCYQLRSNLHGHGRLTSVFSSATTNYCPWCRSTFSTTPIARRHAAPPKSLPHPLMNYATILSQSILPQPSLVAKSFSVSIDVSSARGNNAGSLVGTTRESRHLTKATYWAHFRFWAWGGRPSQAS